MTIQEANRLLQTLGASKAQLLKCYEDLCKEYGYIQGMTFASFRDAVSSRKTLVEMQGLIEQIHNRLLKCTD
jgi:hypothetical protein